MKSERAADVQSGACLLAYFFSQALRGQAVKECGRPVMVNARCTY